MTVPPVLVEVTRGSLVESVHRGSLVLLEPSARVTLAVGEVDVPVYARSSLKPLQASAMVGAGLALPSDLLALAAASHNAEPAHVAGARRILAGAGADEDALQCPPDLPAERADLLAWIRDGHGPARVCHNCSGKHSAMIATCRHAGWDAGGYLDPAHPLQRTVLDRIEALAGEAVAASSVDGCGAPAHAITLTGLARSFSRVATAGPTTDEEAVAAAMRAHPFLVGGTGRAATELMAAVPGLIAKDGAEGIWAAALPDGRAFAAKIADGSARALGPLLAAVLRHWLRTGVAADGPFGVDEGTVERWSAVPTLGGGRPVGALRWSPELREALDR